MGYLNAEEAEKVAAWIAQYLGYHYDLKNVIEIGAGKFSTPALHKVLGNNFIVMDLTDNVIPHNIPYRIGDATKEDLTKYNMVIMLGLPELAGEDVAHDVIINARNCDVKSVITSPQLTLTPCGFELDDRSSTGSKTLAAYLKC